MVGTPIGPLPPAGRRRRYVGADWWSTTSTAARYRSRILSHRSAWLRWPLVGDPARRRRLGRRGPWRRCRLGVPHPVHPERGGYADHHWRPPLHSLRGTRDRKSVV